MSPFSNFNSWTFPLLILFYTILFAIPQTLEACAHLRALNLLRSSPLLPLHAYTFPSSSSAQVSGVTSSMRASDHHV